MRLEQLKLNISQISYYDHHCCLFCVLVWTTTQLLYWCVIEPFEGFMYQYRTREGSILNHFFEECGVQIA